MDITNKLTVSDIPNLMKEWNTEKNDELGLIPEKLTIGSSKKVWWICDCGHEWQAIIENRTKGKGCPYCSGRMAIQGVNDLATLNPELADEWNILKNKDLLPTKVLPSSNKKVWWICKKGHEWQATIGNRTRLHSGCPVCGRERKTSFPEQAILFYCSKITVAKNRDTSFGKELDVYLPEYNIGIEYNGKFYHKDKEEADIKKIRFFSEKNIRVITVEEGNKNSVIGDTIQYIYSSSNKENLNWAISEIFNLIGLTPIPIDVLGDTSEILSQYITLEKENSLATKYPNVSTEWNYEKNASLTPDLVSYSSDKKVWWKCDKAHEWQATISSRIAGHGCPYCKGLLPITGETDLATKNPSLAAEWNAKRNGNILPSMVSPNSVKKVWWTCPDCGSEYQAKISNRNNGNGCPVCSTDKRVASFLQNKISKEGSLAEKMPELAKEWHTTKNGNLTPNDVLPGTNKKVWWRCSLGHEWETAISNRALSGTGCPYCSGQKVLSGYNDLATSYPDLAVEWASSKNNGLTPNMVSSGSSKKVWWVCSRCGNEYISTISGRKSGKNCPYCANRKILPGFNDLATINPRLSEEWDTLKNGTLSPTTVAPSSSKKVWWICKSCGNSWEATINNRSKGRGCPVCAKQRRLK